MIKSHKRLIIILIVFSFIILSGYIFIYSPEAYRFKDYTYTSNKITKDLDTTTIACISDVHLKDTESLERFTSVIEDLNEYPVDLVFFLGDLYDDGVFSSKEVSAVLKTIQCQYGKFAVMGDKDLANESKVRTVLNTGGFEVLDNGSRPLYINGTKVNLVVSSLDAKNEKIKLQDKTLTIAISHTPDTFTNLINKVDLQLSGHSMGGYIHFPIIGSLVKTEGAKTYTHGQYIEEKSTLIVSNGISAPASFPYKFGCKNEIIMIRLEK